MVFQDEGERGVGQECEEQGVVEEEVESEGEREVDVAQTISSLFSFSVFLHFSFLIKFCFSLFTHSIISLIECRIDFHFQHSCPFCVTNVCFRI